MPPQQRRRSPSHHGPRQLHGLVPQAAAREGRAPGFSPLDRRSQTTPERLAATARRAAQLRFLSEAACGSLSAAAIRFVLSYPQVASVATGVMRLAELDANLAARRQPTFDPALLQRAHALWAAGFGAAS